MKLTPYRTGRTYQQGQKARGIIGKDEFEEGKCVKKLKGWFCWHGVWEGRLHFTDDQYWGREIEELSRLYNDKIMPWCKDFIKNRDPDNAYND